MNAPLTRLPPLYALTSVRFLAAAWVVLLHFGYPQSEHWPAAARNFAANGQRGVTFFFVLSGFVLGYNYLQQAEGRKLNIRTFFLSRVFRLYPMYLFAMLIHTPFALQYVRFKYPQDPLPPLLTAGAAQVMMLQAWVPKVIYAGQWNTPLWSLSCEAFFYALFPFLAWQISRITPRRALIVIAGCVLTTVLLYGLYTLNDPDRVGDTIPNATQETWAGILYYVPLVRVLEFIAGIAIARLFLQDKRRNLAWLGPVGLAGVVGLNLLHQPPSLNWLTYPLGIALMAATIYGLACPGGPIRTRIEAVPFLLLLGEASYGLYVLQRPVAEYYVKIMAKLGVPNAIYGGIGHLAIYFSVLVAASIAGYFFLEKPALRYLRRRYLGETRRAPDAPAANRA